MKKKFKRIIDLHGVPRSGTSWLGQILDSSEKVRFKFQPLFSDRFKNYINLQSTKNEIDEYYEIIYNTKDEYLDRINQKKEGVYPVFKYKDDYPEIVSTKHVTHHYLIPYLLDKISNYQVIGVIRNPCAVLVSFKNYPSDYNPNWEFRKEWEFSPNRGGFRPENYFGFHKWKEFVMMFLTLKKKYPDKVYIITYENMVKDTYHEIEKMYDFLKLPLTRQTLDFLDKSTSEEVENSLSVFKKNKDVNSWQKELNQEIIMKIVSELSDSEFSQFI